VCLLHVLLGAISLEVEKCEFCLVSRGLSLSLFLARPIACCSLLLVLAAYCFLLTARCLLLQRTHSLQSSSAAAASARARQTNANLLHTLTHSCVLGHTLRAVQSVQQQKRHTVSAAALLKSPPQQLTASARPKTTTTTTTLTRRRLSARAHRCELVALAEQSVRARATQRPAHPVPLHSALCTVHCALCAPSVACDWQARTPPARPAQTGGNRAGDAPFFSPLRAHLPAGSRARPAALPALPRRRSTRAGPNSLAAQTRPLTCCALVGRAGGFSGPQTRGRPPSASGWRWPSQVSAKWTGQASRAHSGTVEHVARSSPGPAARAPLGARWLSRRLNSARRAHNWPPPPLVSSALAHWRLLPGWRPRWLALRRPNANTLSRSPADTHKHTQAQASNTDALPHSRSARAHSSPLAARRSRLGRPKTHTPPRARPRVEEAQVGGTLPQDAHHRPAHLPDGQTARTARGPSICEPPPTVI